MFCQKCGTSMAEAATACPSCNSPVARGAPTTAAVADTVKAAYSGALSALKGFMGDPVGRLPQAYAALGDAKALRIGVTYGVFSVLCFLLGGYLMFPFKDGLIDALGFGGVMKGVMFAVAPFACLAIGGIATRKVFGGQGGGNGGDAFVAGAALLPMSFAMVINGLLGLENYAVAAVVSVFAGCTGALMLFSGYSRIARLTERAATLAIPIVVVLTFWVGKTMAAEVMGSMFGGGMGGMGGFGSQPDFNAGWMGGNY